MTTRHSLGVGTPTVPLTPPRSLSPSKVSSFTSCPLAFRFSAIDHLPEPPTIHTVLGTVVHQALEGLFWHHRAGQRSEAAAEAELDRIFEEIHHDDEVLQLSLDASAMAKLRSDAGALVANYFAIEDPNAVADVGIELTLESDIAGTRLRGILDRLDRNADGTLVVVDYKTGRVPHPKADTARLAGVQFYALLCQYVLGCLPERVRLLYLRGPLVIEARPSKQAMVALSRKTAALWSAILRACQCDDFRPRPSPLCGWCHFRPICPAHGAGHPEAPEPAAAEPAAVDDPVDVDPGVESTPPDGPSSTVTVATFHP